MKAIKIGDEMFHPCSIDIIKHKVVSIRQFEGFNHYVLEATNNVGDCGRVQVIIDEHKGKFRFVKLINEENIEYASGLQDFVEGNYYRTKIEADLEYYERQRVLAWSNMEQKKSLYLESKARHEQVELLVKKIKEDLKK